MQRLTLFSTTGAAARMMLALLVGAMLVVASPAQAQRVALTGVASGEVVTKPVILGAIGDDKTAGMTLQLVGPNGYTRVATSEGNGVSLQTAGGGLPVAWDPGAHPEGKYRLTATARRSAKGSGRLVTQSAWFTVRRALAGTAPADAVAPKAGEGPQVAFANPAPTRLTQGQGRGLDLVFKGTLPADGDVMLLCWDKERGRLVPEFTGVLTSAPWSITAEQLNRLPAGKMELQAHLRRGGRVVKSVRHPIEILALTTDVSAQPGPSTTTVFEGVGLSQGAASRGTVGGERAAGGAPAASNPQRRAGGGGVSAGNGLSRPGAASTPEAASVPSPIASNPQAPGVAAASSGVAASSIDASLSGAASSPTVADLPGVPIGVVLTPEAPVVTTTPAAGIPTPPQAPVATATPVTPAQTPVAPVVATPVAQVPSQPQAPSAPAPQITPVAPAGSGPVVVVEPQGGDDLPLSTPVDLPSNAVVEVVAWSIDQGRLIHTFAHTLDGSSLVISAERLRSLPEGRVELEFTAVVDGERLDSTFRTISVLGALAEAGDDGLTVASAAPFSGSPVVGTVETTPSAPTSPATSPATGTSGVSTTGSNNGGPVASPTSGAGAQAPAPSAPAAPVAPVEPATPADAAPVDPAVTPDAPVTLEGLNRVDTGFTVIEPSDDTRTIYVSADGNDANAGTSPSAAVATFVRARDLIRDGMPDHIRFKAGDTFEYGLGVFNKSGRSAEEPIVLGVYGEGPRPKFDVPEDNFLVLTDNRIAVNNVTVQGLHAEAAPRNPFRPGFQFDAADRPRLVHQMRGIFIFGDVSNVLIEDCVIDWFKDALVFQGKPNEDLPIRNVTLRRSIITNSYSVRAEGHSQGMYAELVHGLTIEENVFDHNGWCEQVEEAQRTLFNHNIYVQYSATDVTLTGNVLTRGASHGAQVRPGGQVIDNLFVRNALATFVARSASLVAHNVVLQADDIGPDDPRGFGIEVFPGPDTRVINNVLSTRIGSAFFAEPIGLSIDKNNLTRYSGPTRVELADNKIYRWPIEFGRVLPIRFGIPDAVVVEARNAIDIASGSDSDPGWVDPSRNVESYMATLQRTPTFEAFIAQAAARPRGEWLPELSAAVVNSYVRRGFDVVAGD